MKIIYFKNTDYKYATRNRHSSIPSLNEEYVGVQLQEGHCRTEYQRKVLLGDGVNTSIKTSSLNICDYVLISKGDDDNNPTRWFVVLYNYLNGGQIELQLRRDVVGEFGLANINAFGKIQRGYLSNNSILINKKELSVNEILKYREHLLPDSDRYGEFTVTRPSGAKRDDDLWGILYFVKDKAKMTEHFDIPEFSKINFNLGYDTTNYIKINNQDISFTFFIRIKTSSTDYIFDRIELKFEFVNGSLFFTDYNYTLNYLPAPNFGFSLYFSDSQDGIIEPARNLQIVKFIAETVGSYYISQYENILPSGNIFKPSKIIDNYNEDILEYNNSYVKENGHYYSTSVVENLGLKSSSIIGNGAYNGTEIVVPAINNSIIIFDDDYSTPKNRTITISNLQNPQQLLAFGSVDIGFNQYSIKYIPVFPSDVNALELIDDGDIVDEPFFMMAMPLFNCTIDNKTVEKVDAFFTFNSIIKGLSGDNPFLIDAQVVPYCPDLKSYVELKHYHLSVNDFTVPLFYLKSSSYERDCSVSFTFKNEPVGLHQINTNKKKEYSKRNFAVVSPEQSGKTIFNFYDYVRPTYTDNQTKDIKFKVKVALKPYSLISSCIIERVKDENKEPIQGETYDSDLRGCQPNSGGFQASLASNAFQEYKRQNSNYQQIFNKQQESLAKQHVVERGNEITQGIMNTLSMTAMGAIAGAQMASAGFFVEAFGTKSAGAAIGAAAAGGTTLVANAVQFGLNENMRQYEYAYNQKMFDLNIGTIKNLPDSVNRISSFNEIILKDFWFTLELYECTEEESFIVDTFFEKYGYEVGIYDDFDNYKGHTESVSGVDTFIPCFLKGELLKSTLNINLHNVLQKELEGGIYLYD